MGETVYFSFGRTINEKPGFLIKLAFNTKLSLERDMSLRIITQTLKTVLFYIITSILCSMNNNIRKTEQRWMFNVSHDDRKEVFLTILFPRFDQINMACVSIQLN